MTRFFDLDEANAALPEVRTILESLRDEKHELVQLRDVGDPVELATRYGALLINDETHTICAGPGGYTAAYGLEPDLLTIGKPIGGEETMPVRFVNMEDIKAFAAWRSKRDNTTYRLPTEQEWEYAARNGSKKNLYPWGDSFDPKSFKMRSPSFA